MIRYLVVSVVAVLSFLIGAYVESIYFDRTYAVRELQDNPLYQEMFPALPRPSAATRESFDQIQLTTLIQNNMDRKHYEVFTTPQRVYDMRIPVYREDFARNQGLSLDPYYLTEDLPDFVLAAEALITTVGSLNRCEIALVMTKDHGAWLPSGEWADMRHEYRSHFMFPQGDRSEQDLIHFEFKREAAIAEAQYSLHLMSSPRTPLLGLVDRSFYEANSLNLIEVNYRRFRGAVYARFQIGCVYAARHATEAQTTNQLLVLSLNRLGPSERPMIRGTFAYDDRHYVQIELPMKLLRRALPFFTGAGHRSIFYSKPDAENEDRLQTNLID